MTAAEDVLEKKIMQKIELIEKSEWNTYTLAEVLLF